MGTTYQDGSSLRLLPVMILAAGLSIPACSDGDRDTIDTGDATETMESTTAQIGDAWITTKVQSTFFLEDDLRGRTIDVTTTGGTVTLEGEVRSDAERDLAVRLASSIDGVDAIDERLVVVPPGARDDSALEDAGHRVARTATAFRIATEIRARYFADDEIKSLDVDVDAVERTVTLTGHVPNERVRQRAVSIARAIDGVEHVDDRLTVGVAAHDETARHDETVADHDATATDDDRHGEHRDGDDDARRMLDRAGTAITDAAITTWVTSKLFVDDELKMRDIDVTTNDGVVTLEGIVESEAQRRLAVTTAAGAAGVERVEDRLDVVPAEARVDDTETRVDRDGDVELADDERGNDLGREIEDSWITTKIQAKFFLDDLVRASGIEVTTVDGHVRLSGSVADEATRQRALEIVRDTRGVTDVTDALETLPS